MRLTLAAVGRLGAARSGPEGSVFETYARRLSEPLTVREVADDRARATDERRRREGSRLLTQIPDGATVVALDEGGETLGSRAFAARLQAWRDDGVRDVCFIIGGADGLDAAVKARANMNLSFGSMTWPHLLVRGMLAEQLFRAQCILARHPYHRD
jgi:23S rRNA (pseudouridine1915-N3)-methyltransferase